MYLQSSGSLLLNWIPAPNYETPLEPLLCLERANAILAFKELLNFAAPTAFHLSPVCHCWNFLCFNASGCSRHPHDVFIFVPLFFCASTLSPDTHNYSQTRSSRDQAFHHWRCRFTELVRVFPRANPINCVLCRPQCLLSIDLFNMLQYCSVLKATRLGRKSALIGTIYVPSAQLPRAASNHLTPSYQVLDAILSDTNPNLLDLPQAFGLEKKRVEFCLIQGTSHSSI